MSKGKIVHDISVPNDSDLRPFPRQFAECVATILATTDELCDDIGKKDDGSSRTFKSSSGLILR